ncbi:M28 family peptidase [Fulvivirga ligni]|uniref:M28 family peptidase n=1 Tax=Fulvivirga ligni TaxID=2904246 RepID=UPI001F3B44F8|nr:M28 family peptidase [Fulvivirga ligni]UII20525.1 M28 family peptidase [Fulvivirga ligni]
MKIYSFIVIMLLLVNGAMAEQIDTLSIKTHLNKIINTERPRSYRNIESLNYVADYIFNDFNKYADTVYYQPYHVNNQEYKNVVCVFGNKNAKTVVIGAHYDVCGSQDGADDNASGVVGLLELAKLLKGQKLNYRIEIVAYTLEEPPFFRTENMGSFIHAKSLYEEQVDVYGMVSLETIGYFDDSKRSQDYPIGILSLIYGNKGNYITLVNKFSKGKFCRKFNKQFKSMGLVRTKKFTAPAKLPGIDFSDHLNYWAFDYSALMITDTAFYRNKNYHQNTDTIETLDLARMSKVIDAVYQALIGLK